MSENEDNKANNRLYRNEYTIGSSNIANVRNVKIIKKRMDLNKLISPVMPSKEPITTVATIENK